MNKRALALYLTVPLVIGSPNHALAADEQEPVYRTSEQAKSDEDRALEVVKELEGIKLGPSLDIEGKKMQARDIIYSYALELKGLESGSPSREDIWDAVNTLAKATFLYVDKEYGNENQKSEFF